jgi:lipopolysaccharide export system permease protein
MGDRAAMTRLLDRYVLGIFVPALALFTLTLLFLFIAVDCAAKLGKFLEMQGQPVLPFMMKYYLVRIPMLLGILIPAVMLFAPTFTVIKLARTNESLPIATSGISLRRMSAPFVLAAVLASFSMAAMDEFVLPWVGSRITETDAEFVSRGFRYNVEDYDRWTKIWAKRFDVPATLSEEVRITRLDDAMQPVEIITAKKAHWDLKRKRWVAFEGFVEKPMILVHVPGEKPHTWKEPIPEEGTVVESRLTPETLRKDMGVTARLSFAPLKNQIRDMHRYPHVPSAVLQVHARFSFPLSPIVLLLLGLPFVMDPQSKSFVKGLIFCFLLALGFYITHFACIDMGNRGAIPPVVGAWLPVGAFGAAGLIAFSRMRT